MKIRRLHCISAMALPENCTASGSIIALLQPSWQPPNLEYQRTHDAPDIALLSVHLGELAGKARDFVLCRKLQNRRGDDVNRPRFDSLVAMRDEFRRLAKK